MAIIKYNKMPANKRAFYRKYYKLLIVSTAYPYSLQSSTL